jgi:hypothetical protein
MKPKQKNKKERKVKEINFEKNKIGDTVRKTEAQNYGAYNKEFRKAQSK